MSLFPVPGWSVPSAPVNKPNLHSRKRKRANGGGADNEHKVQTAEINFEKLMEKLEGGASSDASRQKKNNKKKRACKGSTTEAGHIQSVLVGSPQRSRQDSAKQSRKASALPRSNESEGAPTTKSKKKRREPPKADHAAETTQTHDSAADHLTTLQAGMKNSLEGARFRWINEVLYKSNSSDAHQMMMENPKVYEEYHTGFRHQVHSWPDNPVSHYIASLSKYPQKTVIADLGCGDAVLARALIPQGMTVLSFDLVSDNVFVVEADTCSRLPLPGSEGHPDTDSSEGQGAVVDVIVCALSLMGTNWPACIREAWRVLRPNGELKIAEVTSRFTDVDAFTSLVSSVGFRLKSKDDRNTHFTLFEFKKVPRKPKNQKDWDKLISRGSVLKPCEYKRR